jgi:hypothetical protein
MSGVFAHVRLRVVDASVGLMRVVLLLLFEVVPAVLLGLMVIEILWTIVVNLVFPLHDVVRLTSSCSVGVRKMYMLGWRA